MATVPIYRPITEPTDEGNEIRGMVSDVLVELDLLERLLFATRQLNSSDLIRKIRNRIAELEMHKVPPLGVIRELKSLLGEGHDGS